MATANPRFSPWIPVVSVNCINPFSSLFFSLWEYVKRLLWFLVIRNYVHWWHGFPTWKHDIHIHRLALQTIVLLLLLTQRLRRHTVLQCSAAPMHFHHSGFDTVVVYRVANDTKDTLESGLRCICRNPTGITFQTTSKCCLDWQNYISCGFFCFCSPDCLESIWVCQKMDLGLQPEKACME